MRKLTVLAVALVTALAVAAVAIAQTTSNTYKVTAAVTPTHKGSKKKPTVVKLKFAYQINGPSGRAPYAVNKYKIDVYGVRAVNGAIFPKCTYAQLNPAAPSDANCPAGSQVGSGEIQSAFYNDATPESSSPCNKHLKLYNGGKGKVELYLYGPGSDCLGVGTPFLIDASYVKGSGGGTALTFTVPPNILHPIAGTTTAVQSVSSTINIKSKKVKGVKKGYYESIGCLGSKRPVAVTFTTEEGVATQAKTNTTCSK